MSRLRTIAKLVRFSPDEIARISERARTCGRTTARYIRETALGAIPKARHHGDREALLREFARTGRNLDRIARVVEASGADQLHSTDREELLSAVVAHRAVLRAIMEERSPSGRAA